MLQFKNKENNFAYIDSQNLNLGIKSMGWFLDFKKFRTYLKEKYNITQAYIFIGYIPKHQNMYSSLQKCGYILIFKPVILDGEKKPKGNVDADLVLQAMIDFHENKFNKALIVTSDGDFYSLIDYFYKNKKLAVVMSPYFEKCSSLLKETAKEKITFMDNLREKLEYKRKGTA
ncbi:MAG: NYN domain-containing protein [Patescibacteria group bacterium]